MTLEEFEAECAKFGLVGKGTPEPCFEELQLQAGGFVVACYVGEDPEKYGPTP